MKGKYHEKKLIIDIQATQSPEAFAQVYDLYIEKIYRFVYIKVSNTHDAEDIVGDVFLKAWEYMTGGSAKRIESLSGLLYQIARNKVIDFYRKRSQSLPMEEEQLVHVSGVSGETEKEIERVNQKMEAQDMMRYIEKMKQEYQEIILLKYIEEYSTKEIADILQKSKTNVRVTLHRAVKALRLVIDTERS